jgi:hypothetical protein
VPAPISAESHDSSPTNEQGSECGLCKRQVMQIRRAVGCTKALRSAGWPTIFSYFGESALASIILRRMATGERVRNFAILGVIRRVVVVDCAKRERKGRLCGS